MLPRVFSHIAEFNEAGYQSIPALAFVAKPLILWSPSGSQITSAKAEGVSVLGPDDLLALVRKSFVRIHGREEWLTSQEHREVQRKKTRWPHARWSDFDDGLCEIANDDRAKPANERRVFFSEPDGGGEWAEGQFERDTSAAALVCALVEDPEVRAKLPAGTCEKIERAKDVQAATKAVLRDIHNHAAAFSEARAISVEPPAFAPLISQLAGDVIEARDPAASPGRRSALEETLEMFTTLLEEREAPTDLSEVEELLRLRFEDPRIEIEIGSLLAEPSSAAWLDSQIAHDKAARRAWDEIFPADKWDVDRAWVFIAALMAGFEVSLGAVGAAAYRFLPRVLPAGKTLARRQSLALDFEGPRVPFLLAYGQETPTYAQIGEMRGLLQEFLARSS
ncbi:MAG TPA: hypothetical protein VKC63_01730 [Solirubrobacterales bacterium]|nr:hypothetical protein [Solirubrobacterales bacterium]